MITVACHGHPMRRRPHGQSFLSDRLSLFWLIPSSGNSNGNVSVKGLCDCQRTMRKKSPSLSMVKSEGLERIYFQLSKSFFSFPRIRRFRSLIVFWGIPVFRDHSCSEKPLKYSASISIRSSCSNNGRH